MPGRDVTAAAARVVARARAAGRDVLLEHEGLHLAEALGIGVPRHVFVPAGGGCPPLDGFAGDRVVVKVVSPKILHKSDVGGVRVVPRDAASVERAIREVTDRPAEDAVLGALVEEFVPHDAGPGGELLVGMRWTDDFGAVVTFGLGGVHAEVLGRSLAPGRDVGILSPSLRDDPTLEAALAPVLAADLLTRPQRGRPPRLAPAALRALIGRFLDLAACAAPQDLAEFEINPLVVTERGPVALDALGRLGRAPAPEEPPRPIDKIARLLRPGSIAIAGVSEKVNPGRIMLENVLRAGFPAERVTVIKPGSADILGCRCVPDVAALTEPVDLLVVSVEAARAAAMTEEAIRFRRAESVILIPGGMGERAGSEGHVDRLRRTLAESRAGPWRGPVINGANCLGVRSVPGRYDTLFIPRHKLRFADGPPAPLAVLSQSGAFAVSWASELGSINPRYVATLGNQADLTVADWLEHLEGDPDVRVFACYVEGFRPGDGTRWLGAVRRITASGRTVLLYHAGRTAEGVSATASHTASLAGDHVVCRALATSAGAVVAEGLDEFTDLTRLFVRLDGRDVRGLRLGAMSNAGFECVAIADHLGPFELAAFGEPARARLAHVIEEARLGAIVGVRNPLDVTPILGDAAFAECAAAILGDPGVDAGLIGCVPLSGALQTLAPDASHAEDVGSDLSVVRRLAALWSSTQKAWIAVVDAGPLYDPMARALDDAGVPTFRAADRALALFGRWCAWQLHHARR